MNFKAQVSIEFLILFAVSLSVLFVFVSSAMGFVGASNFFLELKKAESVKSSFNSNFSEIYSFSNGSEKSFVQKISFPWVVSSQNNKISIIVFNKGNSKSIEFESVVPVKDFSFNFEKEINLVILKENDFVLIKKN